MNVFNTSKLYTHDPVSDLTLVQLFMAQDEVRMYLEAAAALDKAMQNDMPLLYVGGVRSSMERGLREIGNYFYRVWYDLQRHEDHIETRIGYLMRDLANGTL